MSDNAVRDSLRLQALSLSRQDSSAFLSPTTASARKTRNKSAKRHQATRMHIPNGYDGRYPGRSASASNLGYGHSFHDMHHHHTLLARQSRPNSSRSLVTPGYSRTANFDSVESKVKEEYQANAKHTPKASNFKVLSAPRSKLPVSARRPVPAHERFCMSCRGPPCSLVPENQELARQLSDVVNAHSNCDADLAALRKDVADLQEAHKDCESNFEKLTTEHNALQEAYAPCPKTIEELTAVEAEHSSCGARILGTVDDLNAKKAELKDCQGTLFSTRNDLKELNVKYDDLDARHTECLNELDTLRALKKRLDDATQTCVDFKPSIGLQFVELPGDGIAIKYAPENMAAYQSGVRNNDMILESNGKLVFSKADFKKTLEDNVGGDVVPLLIRRGRGNTVVNLTVGAEGHALEDVKTHRLAADWHDPSWRGRATKFGSVGGGSGEGALSRMGSRVFANNA